MSGLTDGDIEHLALLGRHQVVHRGSSLCREGDDDDDVFLIEDGRVRIVVSPPNGRELILSVRTPGQLVGELAAFDELPRSATLIADEETTVVRIPAATFRAAVDARPTLAAHVIRALAHKLRTADERIIARVADDVPTRLAARLVALGEAHAEHGEHAGTDVAIEIAARQSDLASWVGSSREAVARVLGDLRRRGLVRTGRGTVAIVDLDGLRALARD